MRVMSLLINVSYIKEGISIVLDINNSYCSSLNKT